MPGALLYIVKQRKKADLIPMSHKDWNEKNILLTYLQIFLRKHIYFQTEGYLLKWRSKPVLFIRRWFPDSIDGKGLVAMVISCQSQLYRRRRKLKRLRSYQQVIILIVSSAFWYIHKCRQMPPPTAFAAFFTNSTNRDQNTMKPLIY